MNKKITLINSLTFFIALFCVVNFGFGQILTFDFIGSTGAPVSYNSNYNDVGLTTSTIIRGSGLTNINNNDRFNAQSWSVISIADAVLGNNYMEFSISPLTGNQFDVTTMSFNIQRSATGLTAISLRSSIDGFSSDIDGIKSILDVANSTEVITFTVNQVDNTTSVTYRVYGYSEATGGSGGFEGAGDDITVNGSVSALPACGGVATTWDGSAWDNGAPDISTPVIISGNYTTTPSTNISACSLTVTNNATLDVADNTYVEVQNDIAVDAGSTFLVQPYGAVVQLDDTGAVTNNGTISVSKDTAPMNAWYEYTYWSAPVYKPQIGAVLTESDPSRRYIFNAQNFLDAYKENANDNTAVLGQDDIDDNGDDWQWVDGTTPMEPGVGYAATITEFAYNIAPGISNKQFKSTFIGDFNNGVITVPVYRNDSELNDINWNLIGNPYPSAISADLFLAANSNIESGGVSTPYTLDGAIFLWSQNTGPSNAANGNQAYNFSDADYAIINGSGEMAGGDGVIPNRNIPSGQAFFVAMSNSASVSLVSGDVYTADVTFNNSMRVKGATDNSQFFKSSHAKGQSSSQANKLWIDVTSDNGVLNQTLVAYVNGATNKDDGMYYDAPKNVSAGASAIIYSTIENVNKKFAIQGKSASSINTDEVIHLGFKTSIDVPTLYTLSIAKKEGDFLTNNPIYLKDNLTNTLHDLTTCDYTFASEVGEFNKRFEIVFSNKALAANAFDLDDSSLKITQIGASKVHFKASNNLTIKTVLVFDLLGRQLYALSGNHEEEVYNLPKLKNAVFIAKVKLSNGALITKKAVLK